jgi:drug/metabolite transporter (DMT)-like permease
MRRGLIEPRATGRPSGLVAPWSFTVSRGRHAGHYRDGLLAEPAPTVLTGRLAASLFYQGVVIAGFNFIANMSLLKTYRPSGLAAFSLTTPLFGVLATALVIGEPIGWRLAISAVLVAGGIAAATLFRDRAVVARAAAARQVPGGTR